MAIATHILPLFVNDIHSPTPHYTSVKHNSRFNTFTTSSPSIVASTLIGRVLLVYYSFCSFLIVARIHSSFALFSRYRLIIIIAKQKVKRRQKLLELQDYDFSSSGTYTSVNVTHLGCMLYMSYTLRLLLKRGEYLVSSTHCPPNTTR